MQPILINCNRFEALRQTLQLPCLRDLRIGSARKGRRNRIGHSSTLREDSSGRVRFAAVTAFALPCLLKLTDAC